MQWRQKLRDTSLLRTILPKHASELLAGRGQVKLLTQLLFCLNQKRGKAMQHVRVLVKRQDTLLSYITELIQRLGLY